MEVQFEHDTTVEFNEYFPAIQFVHFVAPGLVPVFVKEPALHVWQDELPGNP